MHVIQKATLFTEITVDECATVSGGAGTVDVGSSLGNQLVSNASLYYNAVIAANNNTGSPTTSTVSNRLLPELAVVSNNLVGI